MSELTSNSVWISLLIELINIIRNEKHSGLNSLDNELRPIRMLISSTSSFVS